MQPDFFPQFAETPCEKIFFFAQTTESGFDPLRLRHVPDGRMARRLPALHRITLTKSY